MDNHEWIIMNGHYFFAYISNIAQICIRIHSGKSIVADPYSKSKSFLNVSLGSFPGFLARTKGSPSSKEIEPAKIKPLLSMLAMTEALNFLETSINSLQVA